MLLLGKFGVMVSNFWFGKRVFVTGHTGFKGCWLCLMLHQMGAKIHGYALKPNTNPNIFEQLLLHSFVDSTFADIRDLSKLTKTIVDFDPDVIIHLAAQAIVIEGYKKPVENYEVNVMGTVNLLEASRFARSLRSIVVVTTDKCYENIDGNSSTFSEHDRLGGNDPYSSSKSCCELVTLSYYKSFFEGSSSIGVATARAGNVIGGGDWSQYRLIPDIIRSIQRNKSVEIRRPKAVRPWQHVLEPLSGYLILAKKLYDNPSSYSEAWNFGPDPCNVADVASIVSKFELYFSELKTEIIKNELISYSESSYLMLDSTKANRRLGWFSQYSLDETVTLVSTWYKGFLNRKELFSLTCKQIEKYMLRNNIECNI